MEDIRDSISIYLDSQREAMLDFWRRLVMIESGSANKAGVDAVGRSVQAELAESGIRTAVIPMEHAGNMVTAFLNEEVKAAPLILLGHMDTVFPDGTVAARPFTLRDGKAYGPGVLDMKGGITMAVYVLKALQAAGWKKRPVKLLLAGDEEVGHGSSDCARHIVASARGAVAAFNCESGRPHAEIVISRKGVLTYGLTVRGIAAHAGNEPEKGRSAILEMAHKIIAIQKLTGQGITYNVGTIKGGSAVNAVPDQAEIGIDVRYLHERDMAAIEAKLKAIAAAAHVEGTQSTLVRKACCVPMEELPAASALLAKLQEACSAFHLSRPQGITVGGGSDSAYTVQAGVPTLCACGVEGGRHHSPDEYAIVESLYTRTKALAYTLTLV